MPGYYQAPPLPRAFIWKRAHSLTGLWLVLFLIEHLLINSQAALYIGDDGNGFIRAVNGLKELPYLQAIEITLLGIPLSVHAIWGVRYLFTAKYNIMSTDGSTPSLPENPRNRAYTWQRVTSWILLFGIAAHVIHMRFLEYPASVQTGDKMEYFITVESDPGLYTLSRRLGFDLYTSAQIREMESRVSEESDSASIPEDRGADVTPDALIAAQNLLEQRRRIEMFEKYTPGENRLTAVAPSFGVVELLMVRETFKKPVMILLYSGLVLAACFHAFNGLWTFMISWGVTLTARSQEIMRKIAVGIMILVAFLGLSAIWGTYWINLTN